MKDVPSKENIENTINLLKLVPLPYRGCRAWVQDKPDFQNYLGN
jgi:hypothetical protein